MVLGEKVGALSKFEFCPQCGLTTIAAFGKNAVQCETCGFVFFQNCASAVAAIIETNAGILMTVRRKPPKRRYYDLPGGFVDPGESLEEALKREIREELNLEIRNLRYFVSCPNTYAYRKVTYFTTDAYFICRPVNPKAMRSSGEIAEILEVKPEAIDFGKIAFESTRQALGKYVKRGK